MTQDSKEIMREKCRIASTGEKNAFFGRNHSQETLDKIRKTKEENGTTGNGRIRRVYKPEELTRPCPKCNTTIQYSCIKRVRYGKNHNLLCRSCAANSNSCIGERSPNYGKSPVHPKMIYYNGLKLRSSFELLFVQRLEEMNIEFQYEPKRFKLSNGSTYVPDFFIPKINKWIEIKGWVKEKDLEKNRLMKEDYNIEINMIFDKKKIMLFNI